MDLSTAFAPGQAYVSLSRARSPAGLQVTAWHAAKVKAHPQAVQLYRTLAREAAQEQDGAAATTTGRTASRAGT